MTFKITKYIIITAIIFSFTGCGGGNTVSKDNQQNNESPDTPFQTNNGDKKDKPHISLNGEKTILLHPGNKFSDPGATAQDNRGKDISSAITKEGNVDIKVPGTYEIIYSVKDSNGNIDTAKRKVIVLGIIQNPESKKPSGIVLNELLALNNNSAIDPDFKQFSDYIELYNHSGNNINIGHYYLSDDPQNLKKWQFPNNLSLNNGEHLLVWADKKDKKAKALHTNFSLSGDGETVILSDASGNIVDQITFKKQKRDISVTKIDDTNYFMNPTPAKQNTQATNALVKSKKPTFSLESGFYDGSVNVELTQQNKGKIYYTTDGSIPTTNSPVYSQPIPVSETTVIRARALENNKFLSSTVNHTFLINENISLPVVSIAIDNKYLYDDQIGIYKNYDEDWMRPGAVEYFKNGKSQFSVNIGLKIHGDFSRAYAQKSLALYTKSKYGSKSISYPLFEQKPHIKKIKSFMLRNSGNDWKHSLIRDGLFQTIVKDNMKLDYCAYQPSIVFINSKYMGILNIREKANEHYIAANYKNINPKNIDLLENYNDIMEGDNEEYNKLLQYIKNHDLANNIYYDHVASQIDIDEYINYMCTEIYVGNSDWLGKNIRYWKEHKEGSKWRWILQDLDFGFDLHGNKGIAYNTLERATTEGWRTIIFTGLLENSYFRNRFITRCSTHLNTTFMPSRVITYIHKLSNRIKEEMPRDIERWKGISNHIDSYQAWQKEIDRLISYAQERNDIVKIQLKNKFDIQNTNKLNILKMDHGTVYIDDVPLNKSFNGTYLNGAKITLVAKPDEGYDFISWSDGFASQLRVITLKADLSLSAEFR